MDAEPVVGSAVVVATGGETAAGLALLRGLRDGAYRPVAGVVRDDSVARWSRVPIAKVRVADPLADLRAHAADVARAAVAAGAAAVLPGTEGSMLALAEHRDMFGAGIVVAVPGLDVVRRATDKLALSELASIAGLHTPPTHVVHRARDYEGPFPAIVKPKRSVAVDAHGRPKQGVVRLARHPHDLEEALQQGGGREVVVQPFMPGRLRTVNGVAWEGRVVCCVHKRSDRTWPLHAGIFSYGRTVEPDPSLEEGCARLLEEVRWSGIFNLQFLEPEGGPHLLIDLNPRPYHSLALATAAGANLPAIWCDLALGRPPRPAHARPGVRFRSDLEDLRALYATARAGDVRGALAAAVPVRHTAHSHFQARDPGPLLQALRSGARALSRRNGVSRAG